MADPKLTEDDIRQIQERAAADAERESLKPSTGQVFRALGGDPNAIKHIWKYGKSGSAGKPSYDANIEAGEAYDPSKAAPMPALQKSGGETGALSGMGFGEQFGRAHAGGLADPSQTSLFSQQAAGQLGGAGQAEQYWNKVQGQFNAPTNAQQAYDAMQNAPGFDAFYDRARERSAGGINNQLAARGMYGSSAGMDMIGQAQTDLNAQQANREADFMLQQQQQRVQAAQGADAQNQALMGLGLQGSQGAQSAMVNRLMSGGNLLHMGDQMGLERMGLGAEMARGVQDLEQNRHQTKLNNLMKMFGLQNQVMGPAMYGQLEGDRSLNDAAMAGEMGLGAEAVAQDRYDEARADAWGKTVLDFTGDATSGFTGGM